MNNSLEKGLVRPVLKEGGGKSNTLKKNHAAIVIVCNC